MVLVIFFCCCKGYFLRCMKKMPLRKNIQTLSPEKERPACPSMYSNPTTSSSSSVAPSIGINPPRVPKSAVRLSLNTSDATTTTKSASNQAIDDALRNTEANLTTDAAAAAAVVAPAPLTTQKSYATATSPTAAQQQPRVEAEQPQQQPQPIVLVKAAEKVDVDPTRNVQHYLQRDKNEFEPFSTVCILAIRCVVPGAKLDVTPPMLSLDRNPTVVRTITSFLWSGLSQNVIYQLLKPLKRAIELYLRQETLHIFKLAEAGLKSLQEIYKNSNAEQALQQMIVLLQDAYAPSRVLPTTPCVPAADEPFANLWHPSEISAVSALFQTVNAVGLLNKEKAAIWTDSIEHTLRLKLRAYM